MLDLLLTLLSQNFLFFALHFESTAVFPRPLSAKEERACFERLNAGDRSARDELVEHNLRLVAHIVKKYYAIDHDRDDLISIGTVGLIKAVGTFDSTKGSRFATYASRCIENEILMHFRTLKKTASELHFDEPVETDKNGNALTLTDLISDGGCIDEVVELNVDQSRLYKLVETMLSDREREIMILRYGLYGKRPLTQREVASRLGISRSYVSRIEKAALEKLRESF